MNARLSYLMLAAGLPVGAVVAWSLGGTVGAGAFAGVLAATFVSALGVAWTARAAAQGGRRALDGFVLAFLAKLAFLALGALALRYVEPLAEVCDWSAYLLGFAATVAWALGANALGHARSLRIPRSTTP